MIQGLSRFCAAPSGGLVMLASHASAIVQCNTITSAGASGIYGSGKLTWTIPLRRNSVSLNHVLGVVAGLVPATPSSQARSKDNRGGRDKPGHHPAEVLGASTGPECALLAAAQ